MVHPSADPFRHRAVWCVAICVVVAAAGLVGVFFRPSGVTMRAPADRPPPAFVATAGHRAGRRPPGAHI